MYVYITLCLAVGPLLRKWGILFLYPSPMLAVWQHIYIYIYVCARVILYRLYYIVVLPSTFSSHWLPSATVLPGSCRNPLASCNNAKAWLWSTSDAAMTCANCNAVSCSGAEPLENTILEWATVAHWNAPSMKRMCKFKGAQIWALKVRNPALASSWEGARSSAEQLQQLWHFQTWNARPKFGRQILDRDFMWENVGNSRGCQDASSVPRLPAPSFVQGPEPKAKLANGWWADWAVHILNGKTVA